MLDKALIIIGGILGVACVVLYLLWDNASAKRALAEASLHTALEANASLITERDRYKADVARVQAQANKLTTDLRALSAAATTFQESLSDAAKNCPLLDADRRAVQCLLYPDTAGCGADRARPPG